MYIQIMLKIRASMLNGYIDCPRRSIASAYREFIESYGYMLNTVLPNIGSIVGTPAHEVNEHILKNRKSPLKDAIDIGMSKLQTDMAEEIHWDDNTPKKDIAEKQLKHITLIYYQQVAPTIKPLIYKGEPAIELYLKAKIDDDTLLHGHVDVIDENIMAPRDGKFGAKDNNYFPQLGAYSLLSRSNGIKVTGNPVADWIPRPTKTGTSKYHRSEYDKPIAEQTGLHVIDKIKSDINNFKKEADPWCFTPNLSSNMCSNKFCIAHGTEFCEITKEKKVTTVVI